MSAPTREQVDQAVFAALAVLKGVGKAKTVKRTLEAFSQNAPEQQPALYLADGPEDPTTEKGFPPLWTYHYLITCYTNRQANTTSPDITMNPILELLRNVFPPNPITGWNDLDGLVGRAWIDGPIERFPGSQADQAVAVVPLAVKLKGDNFLAGGNYWFDVGTIYLVPGTGPTALPLTDTTRVRVGTIRDVRMKIVTTTELTRASIGQYAIKAQNRISAASGGFSFGRFDGDMIAKFIFAQDPLDSAFLIKERQEYTVSVTNEVTPVPPDSGVFDQDLGIYRGNDGVAGEDFTPMQRVTGIPGNSQYSEAGGVYTFDPGGTEEGRKMLFTYRYQVAGGTRIPILNSAPYDAPEFELNLLGEYNGHQMVLTLPQVVMGGIDFRGQIEAFNVADCSFQVLGEPGGNAGMLNLG